MAARFADGSYFSDRIERGIQRALVLAFLFGTAAGSLLVLLLKEAE